MIEFIDNRSHLQLTAEHSMTRKRENTATPRLGGSKEFSQQQAAPETGQWKVSFRSDPAMPRADSEATVYVSVKDNTGKPVTDAQVKNTLFMPAMPAMGMSEVREAANLNWKGTEYAGTIKVPTSGTWTVTVEVSRGGQALTTYRTSLNAK
jgi:hypothetical protein